MAAAVLLAWCYCTCKQLSYLRVRLGLHGAPGLDLEVGFVRGLVGIVWLGLYEVGLRLCGWSCTRLGWGCVVGVV